MPDALLQDSVVVAPDRVNRDLPCISCGYSLMAAARDGRCPECGQPVARSLRLVERDRLRVPPLVRVTAWLLIVLGTETVITFFPTLVRGTLDLPIEALAIPAGFGLLRLSNPLRITALVLLAIEFVSFLLPAVVCAFSREAVLPLSLWDFPVAAVPAVGAAAFFGGLTLTSLLLFWNLRTRRVRPLFHYVGPHVRRLWPDLRSRQRRVMGGILLGSLALGLTLSAGLLTYGHLLDDWHARRVESIEQVAGGSVAVVQPGPAQLTLTLPTDGKRSVSVRGELLKAHTRNDPAAPSRAIEAIQPETIAGREYWRYSLAGWGRDVDEIEHRSVDFWSHQAADRVEYDLRLTCRVPVEIDSEPTGRLLLVPHDGGESCVTPATFQPGTYHLRGVLQPADEAP